MVTQLGRGNEDGVFPIAPQSSVGHIGHLRTGEVVTAFQVTVTKKEYLTGPDAVHYI